MGEEGARENQSRRALDGSDRDRRHEAINNARSLNIHPTNHVRLAFFPSSSPNSAITWPNIATQPDDSSSSRRRFDERRMGPSWLLIPSTEMEPAVARFFESLSRTVILYPLGMFRGMYLLNRVFYKFGG